MRRTVAALVATGLLLAGCAADSSIMERALVMPSSFDPLTCKEIATKYKDADARMKQLAVLMEKSGSPIANALAYDTEYATARASKRFAEQAAQKKGCELATNPVAIAPPPPPPTADVKK